MANDIEANGFDHIPEPTFLRRSLSGKLRFKLGSQVGLFPGFGDVPVPIGRRGLPTAFFKTAASWASRRLQHRGGARPGWQRCGSRFIVRTN